VFLHFFNFAIIGLVLVDMCIDRRLSRAIVKLHTCIYCSFRVELIEFLLRRVSSPRACVRASEVCQLSSLMRDVIIAAHARSSLGRSVGRRCVCNYILIHSVSQLIVPRHAFSHARLSGRPARWSRYACARSFIGLANSLISRITCSVVAYYARLRRYFTSGFLLCLSFRSELYQSVFTADTADTVVAINNYMHRL